MNVVESSPRGLTSTATVAQAESAFTTTMIATSDGSVYANANDPQIPVRFASVIGSIEGLSNTGHSLALNVRPPRANVSDAQPHQQLSRSRNPNTAIPQSRPPPRVYEASLIAELPEYDSGGLGLAFGPADLWTFYDENSLLNAGTNGGDGDCVAVVEDTDYLSSAVTLFDTNFALPAASVTRVQADGASPGINGDEIEALLDIEWAHAVAPGAAIDVYMGTSLVDGL
jgi:subtilase family serine protease